MTLYVLLFSQFILNPFPHTLSFVKLKYSCKTFQFRMWDCLFSDKRVNDDQVPQIKGTVGVLYIVSVEMCFHMYYFSDS